MERAVRHYEHEEWRWGTRLMLHLECGHIEERTPWEDGRIPTTATCLSCQAGRR